MRTVRASELGTYLFCQRAWWYQKRGEPGENIAQMAAGQELHERHGRATLSVGCLRLLAYALLLAALGLLAAHFTLQWI